MVQSPNQPPSNIPRNMIRARRYWLFTVCSGRCTMSPISSNVRLLVCRSITTSRYCGASASSSSAMACDSSARANISSCNGSSSTILASKKFPPSSSSKVESGTSFLRRNQSIAVLRAIRNNHALKLSPRRKLRMCFHAFTNDSCVMSSALRKCSRLSTLFT